MGCTPPSRRHVVNSMHDQLPVRMRPTMRGAASKADHRPEVTACILRATRVGSLWYQALAQTLIRSAGKEHFAMR